MHYCKYNALRLGGLLKSKILCVRPWKRVFLSRGGDQKPSKITTDPVAGLASPPVLGSSWRLVPRKTTIPSTIFARSGSAGLRFHLLQTNAKPC